MAFRCNAHANCPEQQASSQRGVKQAILLQLPLKTSAHSIEKTATHVSLQHQRQEPQLTTQGYPDWPERRLGLWLRHFRRMDQQRQWRPSHPGSEEPHGQEGPPHDDWQGHQAASAGAFVASASGSCPRHAVRGGRAIDTAVVLAGVPAVV
jgi:hypothetical protein